MNKSIKKVFLIISSFGLLALGLFGYRSYKIFFTVNTNFDSESFKLYVKPNSNFDEINNQLSSVLESSHYFDLAAKQRGIIQE